MVNKILLLGLILVTSLIMTSAVMAKGNLKECTTIKSGELYGSDGSLLTIGYNEWGYNYQAHLFNGMYCDYHPIYRPGGAHHDWCVENYGDVKLVMKWSDEWLSNKDCNGDGKLDRGYSCDPVNADKSACPGAWTTNHMVGGNGKDRWTYFTKIVAVPVDAYEEGGIWYTEDGTEIGPSIWGAYATIQEVESGEGVVYLSPASAGFGFYN